MGNPVKQPEPAANPKAPKSPVHTPGTFFSPAPEMVQKQDGAPAAAAPATPATDKDKAPGPDAPPKDDSGISFGSITVFADIFDDLIMQFPSRYQQSYQRAKAQGTNTVFDPAFGQELLSKEIMSLWNVVYALQLKASSPYGPKVDWSKGLEMAEQLSGVSGTYINLASLVLHMDMEKYLSANIPYYARKNLGIFLISGALLQSGMVGLNALTESDLEMTSLLGPATSSFTEAPPGFKRPFMINNIPDERWKSPFSESPDKFELKYTGLNADRDENKLSLQLGFNVASAMDLYPKEEKDKEKYKGFELFPYLSYSRKTPVDGKPEPEERHKLLAGFFVGSAGFYGMLEGGFRRDDDSTTEQYYRGGLTLKNHGPLSLLQLNGELDVRPANDTDIRGRINAATSFQFLDSKSFQLKLGGAIGGLIPSGGERGAVDFQTNLAFNHKYYDKDKPNPFNTGIDATFNYGRQDPFDADSPKKYSFISRLTFLEVLKLGIEYHKISGGSDTLPASDLRGMLSVDFAPAFMRLTDGK